MVHKLFASYLEIGTYIRRMIESDVNKMLNETCLMKLESAYIIGIVSETCKRSEDDLWSTLYWTFSGLSIIILFVTLVILMIQLKLLIPLECIQSIFECIFPSQPIDKCGDVNLLITSISFIIGTILFHIWDQKFKAFNKKSQKITDECLKDFESPKSECKKKILNCDSVPNAGCKFMNQLRNRINPLKDLFFGFSSKLIALNHEKIK
jgi:hypothetical protein